MDRGIRDTDKYAGRAVWARMGCREGCAHQAVPEEIVRNIKDRFWKTDYEKCSYGKVS